MEIEESFRESVLKKGMVLGQGYMYMEIGGESVTERFGP